MDRDPVGLSAGRSVGFWKWTVLIGRKGFNTRYSIPDPTLSLSAASLGAAGRNEVSRVSVCANERVREEPVIEASVDRISFAIV